MCLFRLGQERVPELKGWLQIDYDNDTGCALSRPVPQIAGPVWRRLVLISNLLVSTDEMVRC